MEIFNGGVTGIIWGEKINEIKITSDTSDWMRRDEK